MKFNSILLRTTTALLLNSPATGNITLTNGDFSQGNTGWAGLAGYTPSSLFSITNGAATAPADGSNRCLYQKVSSRLETAATVIFDVTCNTLSSGVNGRDVNFRLVSGPSGIANIVGILTNTAHNFVLISGKATLFTSAFAVTAGTTYTISLYMNGMDGAGGQMGRGRGRGSGSILNQTTLVATQFSCSDMDIGSFDGMAFRRGSNFCIISAPGRCCRRARISTDK